MVRRRPKAEQPELQGCDRPRRRCRVTLAHASDNPPRPDRIRWFEAPACWRDGTGSASKPDESHSRASGMQVHVHRDGGRPVMR